jgi:hypothetical protein
METYPRIDREASRAKRRAADDRIRTACEQHVGVVPHQFGVDGAGYATEVPVDAGFETRRSNELKPGQKVVAWSRGALRSGVAEKVGPRGGGVTVAYVTRNSRHVTRVQRERVFVRVGNAR